MLNENTKDGWDKSLIIFQIVSYVAIPVIIAVVGLNIDSSLRDREIRVKYIELAVGILKSEVKPESKNIRKWAINVLSRYSEIPFSEDVKRSLEEAPALIGAQIVDSVDLKLIFTDSSFIKNP